jgi:hypothetical protein
MYHCSSETTTTSSKYDHIGVNTVAWTNRNHDIVGPIFNPKLVINPWLASTIDPNTNIDDFIVPNEMSTTTMSENQFGCKYIYML